MCVCVCVCVCVCLPWRPLVLVVSRPLVVYTQLREIIEDTARSGLEDQVTFLASPARRRLRRRLLRLQVQGVVGQPHSGRRRHRRPQATDPCRPQIPPRPPRRQAAHSHPPTRSLEFSCLTSYLTFQRARRRHATSSCRRSGDNSQPPCQRSTDDAQDTRSAHASRSPSTTTGVLSSASGRCTRTHATCALTQGARSPSQLLDGP